MYKYLTTICTALILFSAGFSLPAHPRQFSGEAQIGEVLPLWSDGFLDIHHINTGKGESSFFIFPDGTTMLVDAGASMKPNRGATYPKPDSSRTPGEWIARYILHFFQGLPEKKLHYVLISHFHEDHIGEPVISSKISENGAYKLSGISEVAELVTCGKLVDRGWPDYNWPLPLKSETGSNYVRFVKSQVEKGKLQAEQFHVGMNNQFTLMNNPGKYPDFEIRNIAANGHIWTGTGTTERNHFPITEEGPAKNIPGENGCSVAFRLSYGKFDYFSGGDIYSVTSDLWQDVETPAGLVTGPVDVCKANHHANFDTMGKTFLQALRPRVIIIQTWMAQQPDMSVLRRMLSESTYPGPRDIFTTNLREETKIVVGWAADKLKNQQGHTVVRVNPGGASYMVYILDDSEENFRIKAKFGPYDCN